jgi:hypothetical protein
MSLTTLLGEGLLKILVTGGTGRKGVSCPAVGLLFTELE